LGISKVGGGSDMTVAQSAHLDKLAVYFSSCLTADRYLGSEKGTRETRQ